VKKIIIFSATFPPEPTVSAKISYDLALELSKNNIITVVCPSSSRPLGFKFVKKVEIFNFNVKVIDSYTCPELNLFGRFRESVSFGQKCKAFIRNNCQEIDLIYMNVWPLFAQFYILRAAIRYNIKVITHIQDVYPESQTNKLPAPIKQLFNWFLLPIDKYVLKNSDHVITISEKMKGYLMKTRHLPIGKISVVTNWQDEKDCNRIQPKTKPITNSENLTFMYLGNIGPVAGVEFLIESFAMANLSAARLVIAGSGSMKDYCQKLSMKFENLNIEFIDVPSDKVYEIQAQADVMLLPVKKGSAMSSIPSKLPAYMFSKKPIIGCVDIDSDTADSIIKSDCGWVIEPENKTQLIDMFKLISKKTHKLRAIKGGNGFNYAMEKFSQKVNLPKMVSLVEKTISTNQQI